MVKSLIFHSELRRLICLYGLIAASLAAASCPAPAAEASSTRTFPVGETLEYKLYWGILPVGKAEFQTFWDTRGGRDVVVIRATARTTAVMAAIYPVEDVIESTVDPATLLPISYTQKLREGRHKRDDEVLFYHDKGIAVWNKSGKKDKTKTIDIDGETRDVLALTYKMRGGAFAVGSNETFKVLVDDKLYDLAVEGIEKEKRKVGDYGEIECLEVEPKASFGEIFVRKGKVRLWFSEDERRVCVRMTGKVPLANVKAVLKRVQGPGDDFWVKPVDDD